MFRMPAFARAASLALPILSIPACLPPETTTTAAIPAAPARCEAAPPGPVVVFERVPQDTGTRTFRAALAQVIPPADSGLTELIFVEPNGDRRTVAFASPAGLPPVPANTVCSLRLDFVGGEPDAVAIVIEDDDGLVYAAATDQRPGAAVLREGLPGWKVTLLPAGCDSRPGGPCYESIRNSGLAFEHEGQRVVLHHGESAEMGRFRVDCLIAQEVVYSPTCADAGLSGVSYAIARR